MNWMICQASCSLDANKETTASHIPLLVWIMFLNRADFNIKGRNNNWIVCFVSNLLCLIGCNWIVFQFDLSCLIDCIMRNLLMVASLIILGNKIRREYFQDEVFGELSSEVIQVGRPRCIVLVARWMIDLGCRWRVRLE